MKQKPYSWEDASYLTRRSLGVPFDSWRDIGNDTLSANNLPLALFPVDIVYLPMLSSLYCSTFLQICS